MYRTVLARPHTHTTQTHATSRPMGPSAVPTMADSGGGDLEQAALPAASGGLGRRRSLQALAARAEGTGALRSVASPAKARGKAAAAAAPRLSVPPVRLWVRALLANQFVHLLVSVCVLASVIMFCLETMDGPNHQPADRKHLAVYPFLPGEDAYWTSEAMFTATFFLEFIARMISSPSLWQHTAATDRAFGEEGPFFKRVLTWIDMVALLPFPLEAIVGADGMAETSTLGLIKLFKVLRLAKVSWTAAFS